MMHVLRVAQRVYPDDKGGGAYHVHALSRDQAALGHDITILTLTDDTSLPTHERRDGYEIIRYQPKVTIFGNALSWKAIRSFVSLESYDIVHAHSHLYFTTNLAGLRRRLGSTPLAITNHGLYSQSAPRWLFHAYLRTIGRATFNSADTIFCYTSEEESKLRSFGVSTDVTVVQNGIDTDRFSPDGSTHPRIDGDGPNVLFVGRLVSGKRPFDAVAAFEHLLKRRPDAELYVCGDGPLLADLRRHVESSDSADAITILGQVAYDEMPSLFRSSDVLLLPSESEGVPRTVLEAFSSGTPVVTSDLEQLKSFVPCAGRTVSVGDTAGFARALESVLETKSELGTAGRALALDSFHWKDTVRETTERLEEVAESRQ